MMPMASILANSALANASLSGGRRRACARTGGPSVGMKCSALCQTGDFEKLGAMLSGNSATSNSYLLVEAEMVARRGADI